MTIGLLLMQRHPVHHEQGGDTESINGCYLRIGMETRNYEHVQEITQALRAAGFKLIEK